MATYKKYQHIEKLGSSEVEGILEGKVYLSYKIDGTNSCIWMKDDGTLGFGSRNRELSLDDDNAKFMASIKNDTELYSSLFKYLSEYPTHIIYGEWLVPHTLKTYNDNAWRQFYIFDIYDTEYQRYIPYPHYNEYLTEFYPNLKMIPTIAVLDNPTEEEIKSYLDKTGDWLVKAGLGEGIVIKNYDFVNKYGRTTWAKVLCEDFRNTKSKVRSENRENKDENPIEYEIIKLLTLEHILKEKTKIEEKYDGWSDKYIFELLNRVFNEFWRDNWEIILKKFKMPTISFKKLKQLSDIKVKEILLI